LDNLSTGVRNSVCYGQFVAGNIANTLLMELLFSESQFDGVMDFASYIKAGESVRFSDSVQ